MTTLPASAQNLLNPKTQPQFVNPLPIPTTNVIDARNGGIFHVSITQFLQNLGLVDPVNGQSLVTKVWGYNGFYPGPTILAQSGIPVDLFWHNNLTDGSAPLPHLLPVDYSVHTALNKSELLEHGVPIVTHLHGGHTESASDGLPEAWYTPGFEKKGRDFVKGDVTPYRYANDQEAATLWYHDHALGITRLNVYAGLAGFYLLTDQNEQWLQQTGRLPASEFDIPIVIQDRMFTTSGELHYPSEPTLDNEPSVQPEFFGDFILVNGKTWPVLEVEPRAYRFRFLNGSDSRFYNLYLSSNNQIVQIASDGGLLPAPVPLDQMLIAPGERKDVIIDFSNLKNQTIIIKNNAKTPYPSGSAVDPQTTGKIMAFRVSKSFNPASPDISLPATLRQQPINPLSTNLPARKLILFESTDEHGRLMPMLGTMQNGVMEWDEDITEKPALNSTEIWEIYNQTPDAHPIHLHMVQMQLINRQKFTAGAVKENGSPLNVKHLGRLQPPSASEQGWKDTWVMYPGEVTRVIATFDLPGKYVWHCHILSHEDHEMMRPFLVAEMDPPITQVQVPFREQQIEAIVWPNPASNNFSIRYTVTVPGAVSVRVYSAKGDLMKQIKMNHAFTGAQQLNINTQHWTSGTYYCRIEMNNEVITIEIVIQK